jgi:hypothetical protein
MTAKFPQSPRCPKPQPSPPPPPKIIRLDVLVCRPSDEAGLRGLITAASALLDKYDAGARPIVGEDLEPLRWALRRVFD